MLEELKEEVCKANLELVTQGMVMYTWGNVSGLDRERGLVVIKPSGISYESMYPDDMVIVDIESGIVIEGSHQPSSDTPTHLELYKSFDEVGGVTHTHSTYAVAFAQADSAIQVFGTTHADYFCGSIPCTRSLIKQEVANEYEKNTGKVIVETFREIDHKSIPGVLVRSHGPFAWGDDALDSVHNAVVLEEIAKMAKLTLELNKEPCLESYVLEKHYYRKHGQNAYYGQGKA